MTLGRVGVAFQPPASCHAPSSSFFLVISRVRIMFGGVPGKKGCRGGGFEEMCKGDSWFLTEFWWTSSGKK